MNKKIIALIGAIVVPVFSSCASQPIAFAPVGPEPINADRFATKGYLQVFSGTETHEIGYNNYYYPHTGYSVHDATGKQIEWVANHVGDMDESPSLVPLTAGNYKIVAESASYGRVTVPINIVEGRKTVVHLDRDWKLASNASASQVVSLPDGEAVGWSSPRK